MVWGFPKYITYASQVLMSTIGFFSPNALLKLTFMSQLMAGSFTSEYKVFLALMVWSFPKCITKALFFVSVAPADKIFLALISLGFHQTHYPS